MIGAVLAAALLAGPASAPLLSVTLHTQRGDVVMLAEVADEPHERARGLMHRKALAPDRGMLFVFPREKKRTFWMKNTLIPLDMIFIDRARRVVGIVRNAAPETLESRAVDARSQYVLEVNGGFAKRHAVEVGNLVQIDEPPLD